MTSMKGMFVDLASLSFAETAKFGQLGRWPSTHQFQAHWPSFLDRGFEWHREAAEIKFDMNTVSGDKGVYKIKPFSICYVDGFNKAIIMLAAVAAVHDMVLSSIRLLTKYE